MFEGYTPIAPDLPVWMETDRSQALHLPRVYCDDCHRAPGYLDREYPIPVPVPRKHPLVQEIGRLRRHYDRVNAVLNAEYREVWQQYWSRGENMPADHPIEKRLSRGGCLTPEEFEDLATRLRQAFDVPNEWKIVPGARVGLLPLRYYYSPLPDLNWANGSSTLVATKRAVQTFQDAGLTGWSAYPVASAAYRGRLPAGPPPMLYELLFAGRAGTPRGVDPNDLDVCQRCGGLIRIRVPERLEIQPDRWDGSDFFHFDHGPQRYVTERARQVIEAADMEEVGFRDPNEPAMTTEERAAYLREVGIVEREMPYEP